MALDALLNTGNLNIALCKDHSRYEAVHQLSFMIPKGENVGIIGESGCGKSLTCHSILGLLPEEKWSVTGEMDFCFRSGLRKTVSFQDQRAIRTMCGHELAFIAQDPLSAFDPRMKIKHHFLEVGAMSGYPAGDILAQAKKLLERMYLKKTEKILNSYSFQLSGGMLQRVMIAIAISSQPELLIADEPTTALDVTVQNEILKLLQEMQKEKRMQILLVSHDLNVIAGLADRIYVMYAGYIIEHAPTHALLANPVHPYTKRLLAARPGFSKNRLTIMEGHAPGIMEERSGCPFYSRCPLQMELCKEKILPLKMVGEDHFARCERGTAAYAGSTTRQ